MRRPPAPSSAHISTEAGGGFSAHGLASDQPSPLLPTPNPVPGRVPEGFMDEPPPHPNPVPGPVPEGFLDEPPPHSDSVPSSVTEGSQAEPPSHFVPVREGFVDGLPPLPVPGPILEGSEDELSPFLIPVPDVFVEDLSPLPVPVPGGCEDTPSPPAVSWWLRHRSPQPRRRSQRSPHRTSELHRGFSWSCRRLPDHRLLRHRPAQLLHRRPADRRICRGRPPGLPPELWVCQGRPLGRPPELWACRGRPPGRPPELLPSFRGPLRPPWSDVCFVFVLWASGIRP
ncbi:hypothetical protein AMECASPLE_039233 [Ameca splendens]|uniref:Uncharacterized protein n=1 Tax=Ameca splendens TaxID=208324 RepID=A0ABV0Z6A0_9TELE